MSHNTKHPTSDAIQERMIDYVNDDMSKYDRIEFAALVQENPQYATELADLQTAAAMMEQHDQMAIAEPSAHMDHNFYTMLEQASSQSIPKKPSKGGIWHKLMTFIQLPQIRKFGYGLSFMLFGVLVGHYIHLLNDQSSLETERLAIKDQQIQALAVLSLLDMPSANKRLMAVNLAGEMTSIQSGVISPPKQSVVDALLYTLNQDDNVNVRLEALEVLSNHTATGSIRNGLINAINHQESPMVQLAIAQLMLQLNEKQAIKPIQRLLEKPETLEPVRATLNETLEELI